MISLFPEAEVTRSLSNVLKYNSVVVKSSEKLTIDSNRLLKDILSQNAVPASFPEGEERIPDEDGFISGLDAKVVEELVRDEDELPEDHTSSEEILSQRDEILSKANEEAQAILDEARRQAKQLSDKAREEGYAAGLADAEKKADSVMEAKRKALEEELDARRDEMEQEYIELRSQMEPQLVDTLLNVFTQVTRAIADDKKDMIYFLVDNVLRNAEMSHEFTIRVSEEDYKFLVNNKDKLYGYDNPDVRIEVIKDASFDRNKCVIETDSGVFDCSLDIQLDNLREAIHLLSCIQE